MAAPGTHEHAVRISNELLSKKEPEPARVLCWGWLLKQGEGGLLHGDTFKTRWFVLARVPHATVLIYYDRKCMDEDHILGYIDMRRVIAIKEGNKVVELDSSRSAMTGLMHKFRSMMGSGSPDKVPRPVVELVTSMRTYTLCPASSESPAVVSTQAAAGPSLYGKPLYLFGWPFPVPHLDGAVMSAGGEDDMTDDEHALAFSDNEAQAAAQRVLTSSDPSSLEAFSEWRDKFNGVLRAEKSTRVFPVMLLVDSTGTLPQRLLLRVTAQEIALVSVEDKDVCYGAVPFNDLAKWDVQVESELHITARTRSRLVARPDRTGFTTQRPTRPTCHYVFKSSAARTIVACIDANVRALAASMGEEVGELGPAPASPIPAAEDEIVGQDAEEETTGASARAKLAGRSSGSRLGAGAGSASARAVAGVRKPAPSAGKPAKPAGKPSRKAADSEDEAEASEEEKPKKAAAKPPPKKKAADSDEEASEEEKPKKPAKPAPKKKAVDSDEEASEEEKPKKPAKPAPKKKAADSDDDDE